MEESNPAAEFISHYYFYWMPDWYLFTFPYSEHVFFWTAMIYLSLLIMFIGSVSSKIKVFKLRVVEKIQRLEVGSDRYIRAVSLNNTLHYLNMYFYSVIVVLFIPIIGQILLIWFLHKFSQCLTVLEDVSDGFVPAFEEGRELRDEKIKNINIEEELKEARMIVKMLENT